MMKNRINVVAFFVIVILLSIASMLFLEMSVKIPDPRTRKVNSYDALQMQYYKDSLQAEYYKQQLK